MRVRVRIRARVRRWMRMGVRIRISVACRDITFKASLYNRLLQSAKMAVHSRKLCNCNTAVRRSDLGGSGGGGGAGWVGV